MATEYRDAPEVRIIANKVIRDVHQHLHGVRIDYVFVAKSDKDGPVPILSKGKQVHGKAKKITGLNAFLAQNDDNPEGEEFFVIEISHYSWVYMTPEQRIALVDHELCHCIIEQSEDGTMLTLRPHDVEEFTEIIQRHGLWQPDVEDFAKVAAKKLPLFDAAAAIDDASQPCPDCPGADPNCKTCGGEPFESEGPPTITIDMDKKCSRCPKKGATQNGMCMDCTTKAMNAGEFDNEVKSSTGVAQVISKVHRASKGQ